MIPIHPCPKILVNLSNGQSAHNLGFDSADNGNELPNHVPSWSIALFIVLLSQFTTNILALKDQMMIDDPPFQMTECSIDSVGVTKLKDSNTAAWSSVVFCIAANFAMVI